MAYIAGFFDGEGCVQVCYDKRGKGRFFLKCSVTNTNVPVLESFSERWGGGVSGPSRNRPGGYLPLYEWGAYSARADRFLRDIRPWLVVKADQADVAMGFMSADREGRSLIRWRLRELKRVS